MPRPRRIRRVYFEPGVTYFKPAGIRLKDMQETVLSIDEFESVRLKDLESIDQEKAAKKMNISQPTFHRLLVEARKKIADALVNGKAIRIQGGNFKMMQQGKGSARGNRRGRGFGGPAMTCVCPKCGEKQQKTRGVPCSQLKCTKCNTLMIRGE